MIQAPENTPFNKAILPEIIRHMQKCWPAEGCGIIVDNKFIPCENVSNGDVGFSIAPKDYVKYLINNEIQCVVHSHDNCYHASKLDVKQQIAMDIPWGIFNLINNKIENIIFWGDQVTPLPLIGRLFCYGVHDCYSIARDWWRLKGHTMPNQIRGGNWDEDITGLIMNNLEKTGWYIVDKEDIQPGDGILFMDRSKMIKHIAIYEGGDYMIHQTSSPGSLSRRDLLNPRARIIKHVVRFKENQC